MLLACLSNVAGGGLEAKRRCDCDAYRPDTLGGSLLGVLLFAMPTLHLQRAVVGSSAVFCVSVNLARSS